MKFILSIAFILSYFIVTANSFKGVVFDSKNNEPLPYVTVIIKGTTTGTMTDLSGKFLIDKELKPEDIIQISFIGYKSIEIKYDTIANIEFLPIFLEHEEIAIEEIQVSPDNSYARSIIKNIVKNRKRNNPDKFDLIITDITMPKLGGIELAEKVRELNSQQIFIFCSGYLNVNEIEENNKIKDIPFLNKPYTLQTLNEEIRRALIKVN